MKLCRANIVIFLGLWIGIGLPALSAAEEQNWVTGRWALSYDPDNAKADYLEFLGNGDVYNIGHDGARIGGIYVVSDDRVTAVFTQNGRDVITTFFFDSDKDALRIVTSKSGKESIYRKQSKK